MVLTIKLLKDIISDIDDDVVLADLTYGNENFKTFSSVKRLLLVKSKTTEQKYLAINGLGSHFTGRGDQSELEVLKEISS